MYVENFFALPMPKIFRNFAIENNKGNKLIV